MPKITVENSEHYFWGNKCEGWYFLNREDITIIKERMPPGTSEALHFHEKARQFFYILHGTASIEIEGIPIQVGSGEAIEIPPKVKHLIRNQGPEPLDFVLVSSPTTHGDRINL